MKTSSVHSPSNERCRGIGAIAGLAWALTACGGDVVPRSVRVLVSVAPDTCGVAEPEWMPLGCDAEIGVWLLESDGEAARSHRCVGLATDENRTLFELPALLGDARVEFADLDDGEEVGLEVAIYSPRENASCPRFDPDAIPASPAPVYYGRSPVVTLSGSRPVIPLTLACVDWPPPLPPTCGEPTPYQITATVTDMETLAPLAASLRGQVDVSFGDLLVPAPPTPAVFQLFVDLIYSVIGASWQATLDDPPDFVACPTTRVDGPEEALPVVSCQADSSPDGRQISTVGYYIDLAYLPALVDAYEEYRVEEVIVGRVVDSTGAPVAGATVGVVGAGAEVWYLSGDRTEMSEYTVTAAHGYFFIFSIDGSACCHTLWAQAFDEMRSGYSLAPAGLVQNAVTAALIRVQ